MVVKASRDGVVIDVRVIPRSGRSGIAGTRQGALVVKLNAPPVDGAANAELIEILADTLGVPKSAVTIASGDRSRLKRVRVEGIAANQALERLNQNRSPIKDSQSTKIKNH